jgi:hypothetical protein
VHVINKQLQKDIIDKDVDENNDKISKQLYAASHLGVTKGNISR